MEGATDYGVQDDGEVEAAQRPFRPGLGTGGLVTTVTCCGTFWPVICAQEQWHLTHDVYFFATVFHFFATVFHFFATHPSSPPLFFATDFISYAHSLL
jgi:hypothetical protein